ncbi:MAG: translation elongation factor Ts [Oscillospiraceae bacterium]|jgi:elongation factor Ts|nr:translation elongation factor Ts [Oscillospiraceae bacterium]
MSFTAKDVQALREITGAGMMDCKKALTETDGHQEKAIEFLREKGLAAVAKKSGRIAAEGACYAAVDPKTGSAAMVEINSETDFAAKSDKFQELLKNMTLTVGAADPKTMEELMAANYAGADGTVEAALQDSVYKIGENIKIRRFTRYDAPVNAAYVHMGGKIAVLVHLDVSDNLKDSAEAAALGRDVAMQIAAMRPMWMNPDCADPEVLAKEKEIYTAQLQQDEKNKNKPPQVLEKIVEGRVKKYLSEVCLLEQPFVKESTLSVAQYVAQKAKELGGSIAVTAFERYETGEGLAKREDDFAAEVARMNQQ